MLGSDRLGCCAASRHLLERRQEIGNPLDELQEVAALQREERAGRESSNRSRARDVAPKVEPEDADFLLTTKNPRPMVNELAPWCVQENDHVTPRDTKDRPAGRSSGTVVLRPRAVSVVATAYERPFHL